MIPKLHIMSHDNAHSAYTRIDDRFTSKNGKFVFELFYNDDTYGTGSYQVKNDGEDDIYVKMSNAVPKWFKKEKEEDAANNTPVEIVYEGATTLNIEVGQDTTINFFAANQAGEYIDVDYEVETDETKLSYDIVKGEGVTATITGDTAGQNITFKISVVGYPDVSLTVNVNVEEEIV